MKHFKYLFFSLILLSSLFFSFQTNAGPLSNPDSIKNNTEKISTGFNTNLSVGGVMAAVIKAFLGLLGIIFIIIIITAGYTYMTAGGDKDKVEKAITSIQRAVIGLIIIVGAYAITYFVFTYLPFGGSGSTLNTNVDLN